MRVATVIGLLLFACAACALQLHHERRNYGFWSSAIRRRRLASRGIEPSKGLDIVPRDAQYKQAQKSLDELKKKGVKGENVIKTHYDGDFLVYRVPQYFGEKSVVVKKINLEKVRAWDELKLQKEVAGLDQVNQLKDVYLHGKTYYIVMKDKGGTRTWTGTLQGPVEKNMKEADERYEKEFKMIREQIVKLPSDYAWTEHDDGSWTAEPVGEWRFGKSTEEHPKVPKNTHYCGIKGWENGLPIFVDLSVKEKHSG